MSRNAVVLGACSRFSPCAGGGCSKGFQRLACIQIRKMAPRSNAGDDRCGAQPRQQRDLCGVRRAKNPAAARRQMPAGAVLNVVARLWQGPQTTPLVRANRVESVAPLTGFLFGHWTWTTTFSDGQARRPRMTPRRTDSLPQHPNTHATARYPLLSRNSAATRLPALEPRARHMRA